MIRELAFRSNKNGRSEERPLTKGILSVLDENLVDLVLVCQR